MAIRGSGPNRLADASDEDRFPQASVTGCTFENMSLASALFFQHGHLALTLDKRRAQMEQEVEAAPEDHVVQADMGAWAKALAERYRVHCPELKPEDYWMDDPEPVKVPPNRDQRFFVGHITRVPGHRTVVHFPFTGDKTVFSVQPSQHLMVQVNAEVGNDELRYPLTYADSDTSLINPTLERFVERVQTNLGFARADINKFNEGLESHVLQVIHKRQEGIRQHREELAQTGVPIHRKPRDPSKTYIEDAIVRLPGPVLPTTPAGEPIELEPVLAVEIYERILRDVRVHTHAMEQNPATYAAMGEEDRRNVILNALAPNYPTGSSAETFNHKGHTDILIRHGRANIFIAECKFWAGQKKFMEAVDQLFGYQAWRDTKLALLMFVREQGLTDIVERGRHALEARREFVEWKDASNETELRAVVHRKDDEERLADLNVFFIPTPEAPAPNSPTGEWA